MREGKRTIVSACGLGLLLLGAAGSGVNAAGDANANANGGGSGAQTWCLTLGDGSPLSPSTTPEAIEVSVSASNFTATAGDWYVLDRGGSEIVLHGSASGGAITGTISGDLWTFVGMRGQSDALADSVQGHGDARADAPYPKAASLDSCTSPGCDPLTLHWTYGGGLPPVDTQLPVQGHRCTQTPCEDCPLGASGSPDSGTKLPDPCGAAGTWTVSCPGLADPVCAGCTAGPLAAQDYSFTVSPEIAAKGGSWTETAAQWGGTRFSLDLATCTVTQDRSDGPCNSSGACCNSAPYVHHLKKGAGTGSVVYTVICTRNQTECVCSADLTCTESRQ